MSLLKITKNISKLYSNIKSVEKILTGAYDDEILELKDHFKSFRNFVPAAWPYAGTTGDFLYGRHIDAIADHLQALYTGDIKTLIINMPPRLGKSTICSVMWPAWMWSQDPTLRFLTCSYSFEFAHRDNRYMSGLINSSFYRKIWGSDFFMTIVNRQRTENNRGGVRHASSVDGGSTGEGGNFLIIDDPNNIRYIMTSARPLANTWHDTVMSTRKNTPLGKSGKLIVQQRAHQEDVSGYVLMKNDPDVVHLNLAMEYEEGSRCKTIILPGTDLPWQDWRTREGEILAPLQHNEKTLNALKLDLGASGYASQFQQRPTPEKGAVFEKDWFKIWNYPGDPPIELVIQSFDTGISKSIEASYSASTTWGLFRERNNLPCLILLQTWFGRLEFTDLRKMIMQQSRNYNDVILGQVSREKNPADVLLIEAKANGIPLIQTLREAGVDCIPYNPPRTQKRGAQDFRTGGGKIQRARIIAPMVENGRVFLRALPNSNNLENFADHFREVCCNFPANTDATMDLVDTFSMTIDWLKRKNYLYASDEIPKDDSF